MLAEVSNKNLLKMASKKIWIVEDDLATRFLLSVMVKQILTDAELFEIESGSDFITELEKVAQSGFSFPDYILTDLNIGDLHCSVVFNKIANSNWKNQFNSSVYLISATVNSAEKQLCQDFGFVKGFLEKPVNTTTLEKIFHQ